MFLNLVLRGNCVRQSYFFQTGNRGSPATRRNDIRQKGIVDETVTSVLVGEQPHETIPPCSALEVYEKTPIFFLVDIAEDVIELVMWKRLGSLGPGDTDSEYIQGWILKYGEDSKNSTLVLKVLLTGWSIRYLLG